MNKFSFHSNYIYLKEKWKIFSVDSMNKMAEKGNKIATGGNVTLTKLDTQEVAIFIKKYNFPKKSWRYLGRKSPAQKEYNSYKCFSEMNILHPDVIFWGDYRKTGCLHWAILVLKEIPHSADLTYYFLQKQCRKKRIKMIQSLAHTIAQMHNNKFYHGSCRLRNFLYHPDKEEIKIYSIDCPTGHYKRLPVGRNLSYDLVSIYKDISRGCSNEEWNVFIETYSIKTKTNFNKWKKMIPELCKNRYGKKMKKLFVHGANKKYYDTKMSNKQD